MRGDHSTIAATRWQQRVVIIPTLPPHHTLSPLSARVRVCIIGWCYIDIHYVRSRNLRLFKIFILLCYPTKTKPPLGGRELGSKPLELCLSFPIDWSPLIGEFTWHHPITNHTGAACKETGGCNQRSIWSSWNQTVITSVLHQPRLGVM